MPYFINKKKERIRYKSIKGKGPGIIFIHGLNSDMSGQKALSLERFARKNKLRFIRFECRGHGKSDGKFEDFTISDWKKDLIDIIDNIAKGPQILVGSSMGGWLMFLAAKARPKRIAGLIGLAAAPDYIDGFYKKLPLKKKQEMKKKGIIKYSSYGFSYLIKKKYIVDGRKNKILSANKTSIDFIVENKTVILIDDVLYTGRSIRAALTALQSFGRPNKVELLSLIDRRFSRHLPIQPDYCGIQVDSINNQRLTVKWNEIDGEDAVYILSLIHI